MTIHGAGFSARSGAGNNDKTTVAGKGYFVGNVPSRPCALPGRNCARLNHWAPAGGCSPVAFSCSPVRTQPFLPSGRPFRVGLLPL